MREKAFVAGALSDETLCARCLPIVAESPLLDLVMPVPLARSGEFSTLVDKPSSSFVSQSVSASVAFVVSSVMIDVVLKCW